MFTGMLECWTLKCFHLFIYFSFYLFLVLVVEVSWGVTCQCSGNNLGSVLRVLFYQCLFAVPGLNHDLPCAKTSTITCCIMSLPH